MIEIISGTDCVKNEEVLHGVKEDRNILRTIVWVFILILCSAHFVYTCFV